MRNNRIKLIGTFIILFLMGWFTNEMYQAKNIRAEVFKKTKKYYVQHYIKFPEDNLMKKANKIENILNTHAEEGWKLHSKSEQFLIFER